MSHRDPPKKNRQLLSRRTVSADLRSWLLYIRMWIGLIKGNLDLNIEYLPENMWKVWWFCAMISVKKSISIMGHLKNVWRILSIHILYVRFVEILCNGYWRSMKGNRRCPMAHLRVQRGRIDPWIPEKFHNKFINFIINSRGAFFTTLYSYLDPHTCSIDADDIFVFIIFH